MKDEQMDGAPHGSISVCHPSEWMQKDLFTAWFQYFIRDYGASFDNRVLLVLDGHATHTKNLEIIDLARAHGVSISNIPPHTSHQLQPLDISFMKPLSTFYNQALEQWLRNNLGRIVTQFQVASIFKHAYVKAVTAKNAENGFKATGIFPFNKHVFDDHEYAHADMEIVSDDEKEDNVSDRGDSEGHYDGENTEKTPDTSNTMTISVDIHRTWAGDAKWMQNDINILPSKSNESAPEKKNSLR